MSSKSNILNRIKALKLEATPLPELPTFDHDGDLVARFRQSLEANHVTVVDATDADLTETLQQRLADYSNIYSCIDEVPISTMNPEDLQKDTQLDQVEAVIVRGEVAASENGAIWLPEENVEQRILSFITLHFFVVVQKSNIVANMHQAYARIQNIPGFGLFVAGPSKTADIEQSLVIGAHGPKKMTVVLV